MKKFAYVLSLVALVVPFAASAHQHGIYQIGDKYYQFVVGSLNEPVAVDDKTGVDLTVSQCKTSACAATMGPDGDMDGAVGPAVTGLQDTLKVTLIAGGQKKELALSPQWGKPGSYSAAFYPTAATTYAYEFVGTINNTPVDITFTCTPKGTDGANDMTSKQLGSSVTQMMLMGGFGCPLDKVSMGFPQQSATVADLKSDASSGRTWAIVALALAVVALASSFRRRS